MAIITHCDFCNTSDATDYYLIQIQKLTGIAQQTKHCLCESCYQKLFQSAEHQFDDNSTALSLHTKGMTLRELLRNKNYLTDTEHSYVFEDMDGNEIISILPYLDTTITNMYQQKQKIIVQLEIQA